MLNHITLHVSDFEKSKEFYSKALAPLGYALLADEAEEKLAGFGTEDKIGMRDFWIRETGKEDIHLISDVAFTALNKEAVDKFYKVALEAGGRDNGRPGYRTDYYPGYYAAFVLDPDGHNIEAVWDDFSK